MTEILDCYGVPEHYTTETGMIEDAGGGNIRFVRCIRRNGVLIPVYSTVAPAKKLLADMALVRERVIEILRTVQPNEIDSGWKESERIGRH